MALRTTLALALSFSHSQALQLRNPSFDRRGVLAQSAALISAPFVLPLLPAHADVYGANSDLPTSMNDVNKFLKSQGFPAMASGNGMSPLMKYIGTAAPANIDGQKVKERTFKEILLVRWLYPNGWLITSPDITENGEAGTLGANNFIKGDSQVFTSGKMVAGKSLEEQPKEFFDFSYTLLTRAGFTVERKGMASAVQLNGDTALALVCATTALRYKELEPLLRQSVDTFRAYPVKAVALPGSAL